LGYRFSLNTAISVSGSAGVGEHWREHPSAEIPYYVLRAGADLQLDERVTWNLISLRYRNGFDPNARYETPQVATGLSYKLNSQTSIAAKVMWNWREGATSSTGFSLGWRQQF
jgi:hypothetical protein